MAMGGAYVLARELSSAGSDLAAALARYEERIKPSIAKKQKAGRGLARWFVPESNLRIGIRDAVMRMSSTGVGAWLVRHQISGDSVIAKND